jgi:hypothetical protein
MVRGSDSIFGHQWCLQLSRHDRFDFGERFAKLRVHATTALGILRLVSPQKRLDEREHPAAISYQRPSRRTLQAAPTPVCGITLPLCWLRSSVYLAASAWIAPCVSQQGQAEHQHPPRLAQGS